MGYHYLNHRHELITTNDVYEGSEEIMKIIPQYLEELENK